MSDESTFEALYLEHVEPHLPSLEESRKAFRRKRLRYALLIVLVCGGISLMAIAGIIGSETLRMFLIAVPPVVGAIAIIGIYGHYSHKFRQALKARVMAVVCQLVGDISWSRGGAGQSVAGAGQSLGVLPGGNAKVDDCFDGRHRDCGYHLLDVEVWQRRRSGKQKRNVKVFGGLMLTVSVPQPFSSQVFIDQDSGAIGNSLTNWFAKFSGWQKVTFDDPEFERTFEVRAQSEQAARELLTPGFRRSLLEIRRLFPGGKMRAGFANSAFHLTVEIKGGLFEPGSIGTPVGDMRAALRKMRGEIRIGQDIIDILHGDQPRAA